MASCRPQPDPAWQFRFPDGIRGKGRGVRRSGSPPGPRLSCSPPRTRSQLFEVSGSPQSRGVRRSGSPPGPRDHPQLYELPVETVWTVDRQSPHFARCFTRPPVEASSQRGLRMRETDPPQRRARATLSPSRRALAASYLGWTFCGLKRRKEASRTRLSPLARPIGAPTWLPVGPSRPASISDCSPPRRSASLSGYWSP